MAVGAGKLKEQIDILSPTPVARVITSITRVGSVATVTTATALTVGRLHRMDLVGLRCGLEVFSPEDFHHRRDVRAIVDFGFIEPDRRNAAGGQLLAG